MINLFVQDAESIKELNRIKEKENGFGHQTVYMISKYRDIYPRVGDVKRRFSLERLYTMNYCKTLQEMKNRDSLHLYIQRDTECTRSVRLVSKYIIESLGLPGKKDKSDKKRVSQLKSIFNNIFMSQ
ncbi:MAG TPA: hypothetical protein VHP38_06645 [Ruminiclostridium sp.]|nr:hypothetical protein [Ruminiclostridium sp.]